MIGTKVVLTINAKRIGLLKGDKGIIISETHDNPLCNPYRIEFTDGRAFNFTRREFKIDKD